MLYIAISAAASFVLMVMFAPKSPWWVKVSLFVIVMAALYLVLFVLLPPGWGGQG